MSLELFNEENVLLKERHESISIRRVSLHIRYNPIQTLSFDVHNCTQFYIHIMDFNEVTKRTEMNGLRCETK